MKANEMIKGEWYYVHATEKWLIKFNYIENNKIWHTRAIIPNDGYRHDTGGHLRSCKDIKKADKEIVLKFYPNERFVENYEIY